MYIISKFIKPGDVRIASVSRGKYPVISVISPNGTIKVLIQNTNVEQKTFEIALEGQEMHINIPAKTITAIVLKK